MHNRFLIREDIGAEDFLQRFLQRVRPPPSNQGISDPERSIPFPIAVQIREVDGGGRSRTWCD